MKKRCTKCGDVFEAVPDENLVVSCTSCGARMRVRPPAPGETEDEAPARPAAAARPAKPGGSTSDRLKLPSVMRANKVVAGRTCPACSQPIALGVEVHNCGQCGASHHAPCWDQNGECSSAQCSDESGDEPEGDYRKDLSKVAQEDGGDTVPCKFCGEQIKAAARKCRFCNEYQNVRDRIAQEKKKGNPEDDNLGVAEWICAAIPCIGAIACIFGIVWCIQGKKKGPKMVGAAILFNIMWNVLNAIIQISANSRYR